MVKYGSILDCCATYIKEDYINLDEHVPKQEEENHNLNLNCLMLLNLLMMVH